MITDSQWSSLVFLRKTDFRYPDKLEWSVVSALDRLAQSIGAKPVILSDYRPFDPSNPNSQHAKGRAIDVAWPGKDSLAVLAQIRAVRLFSGFGMYTNPSNAQSFHVDTRVERTIDNPALWGDEIEYVDGKRKDNYTTLDRVIDVVKKNSSSIAIVLTLVLVGLLWWRQSRAA